MSILTRLTTKVCTADGIFIQFRLNFLQTIWISILTEKPKLTLKTERTFVSQKKQITCVREGWGWAGPSSAQLKLATHWLSSAKLKLISFSWNLSWKHCSAKIYCEMQNNAIAQPARLQLAAGAKLSFAKIETWAFGSTSADTPLPLKLGPP